MNELDNLSKLDKLYNIDNLDKYFNTTNDIENINFFYLDFLLAGICAYALAFLYRRFGRTISNKYLFATNFVLLTLTITLIISTVKSSLALSLGMVGALSIVRFRTAIKEPEELTFIFLTMALGVGFGAGQRIITLVGFSGICVYIIIRGLLRKNQTEEYNMLLSVSSTSPNQKISADTIINILKKYTKTVILKRIDTASDLLELLLFVKFNNINNLNKASNSLNLLDKNIKITFLEDKGLIN